MAPIDFSSSVHAINGARVSEKCPSILLLDKSECSFKEKIAKACGILGIDLEDLERDALSFVSLSLSEYPSNDINSLRYEWTLRWLLRELRHGAGAGSPCLLPQAWFLLQCLIVRIRPSTVAQILLRNKYTDTLYKALSSLRDDSAASSVSDAEYVSDSSLEEKGLSKKRKLNAVDFQSDETSVLAIPSLLVLSICGTLFQVQCLIKSYSKKNNLLLSEQLKFALSCSVEVTAIILGAGFYLLNRASRAILHVQAASSKRVDSKDGRITGATFRSCARSLIDFWSMKYLPGSELDQSTSVSSHWVEWC